MGRCGRFWSNGFSGKRIVPHHSEKLSERLGKDIILADERAMSQARSPFRRVSSLVDYIEVLLENEP